MRAALAAVLLFAGCSGPLKRAISDDDLPAIERALAEGADVNKAFFAPQLEPAVYACRDGRFEALKLLVAKGARVSGRFKVFSPLSLCAMHGRLDMVKYLLDQGAPIGSDELHYAKRHPHIHDHLVKVQTGGVSTPSPDAARTAPEKRAPVSDVDSPARRGNERPDDFALVIGIEKYSRLPEASFAENDADAMRKHLLALGYPERNIVLLKGGQATRGALSGYVEEWLPKNAKPGSSVFVYFSGHGSPDPQTGDAYLVPWDGDAMFLKSTAYPLKSLYASLGKLQAKRVLVALDSCFSGAGGRSVLAEGARPLVARVDEAASPAGMTVLSAASGDEITATIKDQGHGAFTYYLLKAFNDGKLTAKAAYDELKPRVQDEARRQNREQTPLLLGDDAPF